MDIKGKNIVITGILPGLTREEAITVIETKGGCIQKAVSKNTDILIVGNSQMDMFNLEKVSKKRIMTNRLIEEGYPIKIWSAEQLFGLLSLI
ncbi:BRCT domain-containing protein [Enterococcus avium]|uniref:BRCT domain-containing protein n=1 Tax=Enterococcus avium TaxID=33945 RepID=UPI0028925687|nr:BRCT domain-containing protein [Enterococcus avium]MDT2482628.1 BRCT domain-containing protein [Enterococcus avium]MDT2509324.1 BRCT domain-containing protein [Enterococcus avium]